MARRSGFTLVELLVALMVFAIVASAGIAVMSFSLTSREAAADASGRLGELQVARAMMKADLSQMVLRPSRDAYGNPRVETFSGRLRSDAPFLAFVRRGWENPAGAEARSTLQYVEYLLDGDTLVRRTPLRVDPQRRTPKVERILLTGVEAMHLSFLVNEDWLDSYVIGDGAGAPLPDAVAIELELADYGLVRQLFLTAGLQ